MDIYLDGRPAQARSAIRFLAFGLVAVLGLGLLTARLFYLQVASGQRYPAVAAGNRTVLQPIPSARGLIFDRSGAELVRNVPSYVVKIRPADLPESRRTDVVARLAALLSIDPAAINISIDSNPGSRFDEVRIAAEVPKDIASIVAESHLDLPGVVVDVESRREYPTGKLLSQVLGYTGPIDAERMARLREAGYLPDDLLGLAGIEAEYEAALRGTYGVEAIERDATGRRLQVLETIQPAVAGASLTLTIDAHEQALAEEALRWAFAPAGLKRGAVIVMNPQTGEILALVSLPTYDNNAFARGITAAEYQALLEDPDRPLLNHAVAGHYPPGSTYKLVTATGALADGLITARQKLETKPYLTLGTEKFWEWNDRGWGRCDLTCGFAHSSDTYFYQVAGMLGIDRLAFWAQEWGFGRPTGIDLPGEVSGIVPTNQWKLERLGTEIYPGETWQAGIGQGYDAVTPIQLINAYAALVNGGTLYEPRLVREITGPDGELVQAFEPTVREQVDVSPEILETMRKAARTVVNIRHPGNIVDMPIVVAGKSGTAEFGIRDAEGRLPFHSWFVGFVPKDPYRDPADPSGLGAVSRTDSELLVLAFAYDSRTKSNAAVEVVKYYLQLHYDLKQDFRRPERLVRGNFYQAP